MKIMWNALQYMIFRGVRYAALFGVLYGVGYVMLFEGFSLICLIAVPYGVIIGSILGLSTGITSGMAVGLITRNFSALLTQPARYRRMVGISSAVVTFVTAEIGLIIVFRQGYNPPDSFTLFFFFLLPALIAAGMAAYAGVGFADRTIAQNSDWKHSKMTAQSGLMGHNY